MCSYWRTVRRANSKGPQRQRRLQQRVLAQVQRLFDFSDVEAIQRYRPASRFRPNRRAGPRSGAVAGDGRADLCAQGKPGHPAGRGTSPPSQRGKPWPAEQGCGQKCPSGQVRARRSRTGRCHRPVPGLAEELDSGDAGSGRRKACARLQSDQLGQGLSRRKATTCIC